MRRILHPVRWFKSRIRMIRWGRVVRVRPGLKNHPILEDEPDEVMYYDYKYWIRLYPNPGFNVPGLGYWSKSGGKHKLRRI